MEYTIKKLAEIAGVSTRTLRYYDEIGILKPKRINSSGYRIYGEEEVDLLQEIMIYKSMEVSLLDIKEIINKREAAIEETLINHLDKLIFKRQEIDKLINMVEKTIKYKKGEINMNNKEKFEGLKKEKIKENEKIFGKEIREKYGNDVIDKSNEKFMNLKKDDFDKMKKIEEEIFSLIEQVMSEKNYEGDTAKNLYEAHKEWLMFTWSKYTKEVHLGLSQMYIYDKRFTNYYDSKVKNGATETLSKVIEIFTK